MCVCALARARVCNTQTYEFNTNCGTRRHGTAWCACQSRWTSRTSPFTPGGARNLQIWTCLSSRCDEHVCVCVYVCMTACFVNVHVACHARSCVMVMCHVSPTQHKHTHLHTLTHMQVANRSQSQPEMYANHLTINPLVRGTDASGMHARTQMFVCVRVWLGIPYTGTSLCT